MPDISTPILELRPISPMTMRSIAIGHFTFAIVTLALAFLNGAVESGGLDSSVINTLNAVDTPEAIAMKKTLQRSAEVRENLKKQLHSRLPSSKWIGSLSQTVDIALALLLFYAGSCLLQRQPLGRILSIGFAVVCLTQKLALMGYQIGWEIPIAERYFAPLFRMYPADTALFHSILGPITNGPIYLMVLAVYPILVLAVMLQPSAKKVVTEPVAPTSKASEIFISPEVMFQSSVLQPATDDPLAALMQRKSY